MIIGQANFDRDSLIVQRSICYGHTIYMANNFSYKMFLSMCVHGPHHINRIPWKFVLHVCIVCSCTFRFFVFHILTRCYSIVCYAYKNKLLWNKYARWEKFMFFGLVLPKKMHESFFASEIGINKSDTKVNIMIKYRHCRYFLKQLRLATTSMQI